MQRLIGKTFILGNTRYRVVDARRLNGESLVYAEAQLLADSDAGNTQPEAAAAHPRRMAFHYSDIAGLLEEVSNKIA